MKKSDVAYLIVDSYTQNEFGVMVKDTIKHKVFVRVSSVNGQEWFEGGRNGLNPQYRFITFAHDYHGEKVIEYNGVNYSIYRTYQTSVDEIELYAELKKGNEQES